MLFFFFFFCLSFPLLWEGFRLISEHALAEQHLCFAEPFKRAVGLTIPRLRARLMNAVLSPKRRVLIGWVRARGAGAPSTREHCPLPAPLRTCTAPGAGSVPGAAPVGQGNRDPLLSIKPEGCVPDQSQAAQAFPATSYAIHKGVNHVVWPHWEKNK